jgi:hypothetical protein
MHHACHRLSQTPAGCIADTKNARTQKCTHETALVQLNNLFAHHRPPMESLDQNDGTALSAAPLMPSAHRACVHSKHETLHARI